MSFCEIVDYETYKLCKRSKTKKGRYPNNVHDLQVVLDGQYRWLWVSNHCETRLQLFLFRNGEDDRGYIL